MKKFFFLLSLLAPLSLFAQTEETIKLLDGGTWVIPIGHVTQEKFYNDLSFSHLDPALNFLVVEGDSILTLQAVTSTGTIANTGKERYDDNTLTGRPWTTWTFDQAGRNGLGGITWRTAVYKTTRKVSRKGNITLKLYTDRFFREPIQINISRKGYAKILIPDYLRLEGELKAFIPDDYTIGKSQLW